MTLTPRALRLGDSSNQERDRVRVRSLSDVLPVPRLQWATSMRGTFRRAALAASIAGIGLSTASCASRMEFTVTPHEICAGTPVKVDWRVARGSPRLTTDPPITQQSDRTYLPATTTRFIITVKPWIGKPKRRETAATVYTGTISQPENSDMAFRTRCEGRDLIGSFDRPAAEWDPRLTVGLVESGEGRDLSVTHEGREATLTAQQMTTSAFDGTMLGGSWSVRVPLLSSERCDGTGTRLPNLIILVAHVRCGS